MISNMEYESLPRVARLILILLKLKLISASGGLDVFNYDGPVDVSCVCQLPVPEKAIIRQFVMVGDVEKGEIYAEIGGVR
jgi:hypothetical protein